ncbi:UNVERIFIED_CONTAM: hypothetical protein GTU68_027126 [Idotea baltica]|nr:hypothetical protein [Idotea baltica]
MSYASPEFNLSDIQSGWVVSSPSFAAMIAMFFSGKLSDKVGRRKILIYVAFLYAISALLSAFAASYEMLYIARMIGGLAFGAALVLAPMYIAEISSAKNRGKLVAIQQLNIVLGFFAAFLSNYFFTDANVWRWMLGVEFLPAILYFIALFFVPKSPRWLFLNNKIDDAKAVLNQIHGKIAAEIEIVSIEKNINQDKNTRNSSIKDLIKPSLRFIFMVGLVVGILQQITGINAVYFYATSIFKQTGIGTDAAFSSGILLSSITVVFTIIAMYLIDKMGRRPLLLVGTFGIAFSLLVYDGAILEAATTINSTLVLIGILGFISCFAFSLGPVMWVLLSELYPLKYRGLAIGVIAFVNSLVSSIIQLIFPWELSNLGNAMSFFLFGIVALIGFFIMVKIVPETKGKSLEEIEKEFVKA